MKKYTAVFGRVFRKGKEGRVVKFTEEIEACTFREARDIIRTTYDNAIGINITEIPGSFRENTREEELAYISKYKSKKTNKELATDLGKQDLSAKLSENSLKINNNIEVTDMTYKDHVSIHSNDDIFDTVMYMVKESPEIQEAVRELVKFRPTKIAIEDKIKEVLDDAKLIDYKEDFLVRFDYNGVTVTKVHASKKVNPHTNKKELCVTDIYGDVIV